MQLHFEKCSVQACKSLNSEEKFYFMGVVA